MNQPQVIATWAIFSLAQGSGPTGRIFWSVLALVVAVIVLGAVAMLVRRFMLSNDHPDPSPGFSLAEMRRLRDAGELSEEEYDRVRSALIGQTSGQGDSSPPGPGLQSTTSPNLPPKREQGNAPSAGGESTAPPESSDDPDSPENPDDSDPHKPA